MRSLFYCIGWLSLALQTPVMALALSWDDAKDFELRVQVGDITQERRLTAVNWTESSLTRVARRVSSATERSPQGRALKIVIDPGHGGKDQGARGPQGTWEKQLCLRLARFLRARLKERIQATGLAAQIRLTRENDAFISLLDRARFANNWEADLFISLHANSAEVAEAQGFEVYFQSAEATDKAAARLARVENESEALGELTTDVLSILSDARATYHLNQSSEFAETVYRAMAMRLKGRARGVRQAPFAVLAGTNMPAILVEVGYLTHPKEGVHLIRAGYLRRLASAISDGIMDYVERRALSEVL